MAGLAVSVVPRRPAGAGPRSSAGQRESKESARADRGQGGPVRGGTMADLLFVLVTVGFFVLAWAYERACERL
jgi:hypothetical protein